jgi:DNA-directed RNA polymerase subunit RPC12/RpoP
MTTIDGKKFECPNCGGDSIREFCETLVSCEILRFEVDEDGCPCVEDESDVTLEKTLCEAEYRCANCGRQLERLDLPDMVAVDGKD